MDEWQHTSLLQVVAEVPDPRKARGKRLEWRVIVGVLLAALVSQQRSVAAMAQWSQEHAEALRAAFQPQRGRLPSEATLRRALRRVDCAALEAQLATLKVGATSPPATPAPASLDGLAVDGKYVRGTGCHGRSTLLVSLVQQRTARVLNQVAVPDKAHESRAVPLVLGDRDLSGTIITVDAGLTHPALARHILAHDGHYLMVVKGNQRQLQEEVAGFFETPPLPCERPWQVHETVGKGHGRIETRRLTCTDELDDYVRWPGVRQVLRRDCERVVVKTGQVTRTVTYGLTSAGPEVASAEQLAGVWRGHWTIENPVHYVRDVTFGEDAFQLHSPSAAQALAALRNGILAVLRHIGWTNIAAALRHYNASLRDTLDFIGLPRL